MFGRGFIEESRHGINEWNQEGIGRKSENFEKANALERGKAKLDEAKELGSKKTALQPNTEFIRHTSCEAIVEANKNKEHVLTDENVEANKNKEGAEAGWSDEIVNAISCQEEYEIYKNADLTEMEVGGKTCLVRNDIDWEQKDAMGRTNKERAEQGLSPVNKDGKAIELHHIGQRADSPLAELTTQEHRGKGNDTILHDKTKESEIDRTAFATERSEHWEERIKAEVNNNE